jgi:predicted NAD-dependent protein-ADP-ribosyltransferase YbiA (DUF1768 family)
MVLSRIHPNISFEELKKVDPEDRDKDMSVYELEDMEIAIGSAKNQFADKGIVYFPIYLITPKEHVIQVGVFEMPTTQTLLGDQDDLDFSQFSPPLFYSFATDKYLKTHSKHSRVTKKQKGEKKGEKEESESSDSSDSSDSSESGSLRNVPEKRRDIFVLNLRKKIPKPLKEETEKQAKDIREKYHESTEDIWIQRFLSNPNYQVVDNEGNGDCLFATIRDAFESIGQDISVMKLRNRLAQEVDDATYMNYKENFEQYTQAIQKTTLESVQLKKSYEELKAQILVTLDKEEKRRITKEAKLIKEKWEALKKENEVSKEYLADFRFMKNVRSLTDFRELIRTCEFWADIWAIQTLERVLGIKFIVFSFEKYQAGDTQNVLLCSSVVDPVFQIKGEFRPEYYLLVEYTGNHYKLITYKEHTLFTFKELPFDLKRMIVDKCMERNSGIFMLIPEFQQLKHSSLPLTSPLSDWDDAKIMNLYDDTCSFCFYPKVADKALPGKGAGENIVKDRAVAFSTLAKIPQWRKKLDDFWIQVEPPLFTLNNHTWASVEHYFQASKFMRTHPEFALLFALDSGTDISKDAEMAFAAGGKSGKYKGQLLRPKSVQLDPEFYLHERDKALYSALYAKFTQNPALRELLLATDNAKLSLCRRAQAPETAVELLKVRQQIRNE